MAFVYSIKDTYRAAVEAATGGKNTVMYDDKGNPSVMVVLPKQKNSDIISGGDSNTHPAWIVNGIEKPYIYISKYQNIVQDGRAYSLPGQDPATYVNFDQALSYCYAKGQGWHLMSRAEWAAVAHWCKKNGYMPRGNNNYGSDTAASYEKGRETYGGGDPYKTYRTATGSGPVAWSHDNTPDGIYDLNGNVWEWNSGMRLKNGEIQIIPNNDAAILNADHSNTSTLWKAILPDGTLVAPGTAGTLKFDNTTAGNTTTSSNNVGGDPQINTIMNNVMYTPGGEVDYAYSDMSFENLTAASGVTVPMILKGLGLFPIDTSHGGDVLQIRNYGERFPFSGGNWSAGSSAGVFALLLGSARSDSNGNVGFRAAFVL
jgi:hypothetical protein